MNCSLDEYLSLAFGAAQEAGAAIMRYHPRTLSVLTKEDNSPVTIADYASRDVIAEFLSGSGMVVVTEECKDLHLDAESYWLVDPLDGTKDFLAENGEFTVNIALVHQQRPILGVVFAPAINTTYAGAEGTGAWRVKDGLTSALSVHERSTSPRMAVSRFHDHADVGIFAARNRIARRVAIGSALKFGFLADGKVDVYPRLVGSSEWDTAAGQAVLEAVGGQLLDWHTGQSLRYGKPRRRNPRLLAMRAPYRRNDFQLEDYERELL